MSQEDIEATKAPLMEHLIELRSRLIKALVAFALMFGLCFVFAKDIYNVLVWPFVWVAGPEHSKFIYTALLEYFVTQLKLATFGAAFLSFPVVAAQLYMFVAPGLYKHERKAFRPYLIATPKASTSAIISDRYSPTLGISSMLASPPVPGCCMCSEKRTSIGKTRK